ncbi:unnamed protein product, partial [Arabidopsis halleri]
FVSPPHSTFFFLSVSYSLTVLYKTCVACLHVGDST